MILDGVYPTGWDTDTLHGASRKAIYNKLELIDASIGAIPLRDSFPFQIRELTTYVPFQFYYRCMNTDIGASIYFFLKCPETRNDWKLEIWFANSTERTIAIELSLGQSGNEQSINITNLSNAVAINLINVGASYRYTYQTDVFTVNKGQNIQGFIEKTADESTGTHWILGFNLVH